MVRNYSENLLKADPVIQLAILVGLEGEIPFIRKNKETMLPIITGVILYRQLDHIDKRKVLVATRDLDNPRLLGKIQGLIAQMLAKPAWNPWCMSNDELHNFFKKNKSVSNFLSTWFVTLDGKLEVGFIAVALYQISKGGVGAFLRNQAATHIVESGLKKLKLSSSATNVGGKAFFVTVILASVIKGFSDTEVKKAKKELLNRGLLRPEDL